MKAKFLTFKPNKSLIREYVDYYYLDLNPTNIVRKFECYPHYNNTISFYKSHRKLNDDSLLYNPNFSSIQIYTPIREQILTVRHLGPIYRIVIVFQPLGVQQFFKDIDLTKKNFNHSFLEEKELKNLFRTSDVSILTNLLDAFLLKRYERLENDILEESIKYIHESSRELTIEELAYKIQVSRRHLNRSFKQVLGISAKKYQRIVSFRKALNHMLSDNDNNLTEIAYKYNYADQSHLVKTFRDFTKEPPNQFLNQGYRLGNYDTYWRIFS